MVHRKKRVFCIGLIISLIFSSDLHALSVGSTTVPSRQAATTFPAADSNNTVNAFAWMEGGFTLATVATTCTFDSVLPVSGTVNLNGGVLLLSNDFLTKNTFMLASGGVIFGNNYSLILPKYNSTWQWPNGSIATKLRDASVIMNSPVQLNQNLRVYGASRIVGNGYQLTLPAGVGISVIDGGSLTFEDVIINIQNSSALSCLTDNAAITLRNTTLLLSSDFTFTQGSLSFQNNVLLRGTYKFTYSSTISSTITANAMLFFDQGLTFSYSPDRPSKNLLFMQDQSSYLYLNGCTLYSTITGLRLDSGTVFVDNNVTFTSEARNLGEAMEIGSSLNMYILSEAVLNVFGNVKYV